MRLIFYFVLSGCLLLGCRKKETVEQKPEVSSRYHCRPQTSDKDWYTSGKKAPKFKGLEGIAFPISTKNPEAQTYFNQGLMLAYGFNHAEAARSFFEATRIDSTCAMAFWGYAYVLGPNYNAGMEKDHFERAYTAAQTALRLSEKATPKEKALIKALSFRYAKPAPEDRSALDIAYCQEMKKVYETYSSDADVGALYAESLMDLHPWDLYEKKTKKPKPWTPELLAVLEHLMQLHPKHPGAHHFYIHAVEASAQPEKGLPSARLFAKLVPGSGHLVHMSSHIYINTGDYHLATLANLEAVKIDSTYITACHAQGAYPLAYYPHNSHFLSATATLEGDSKHAWMAAKQVQSNTAKDIMKQPEWATLQHYYTIPYYVGVKLKMWDTILAMPMPEKQLIYPRAVLHYARGMAYLGKGNRANAVKELDALQKLSKESELKSLTIWNINTTYDLIQIAAKVLAAETFQQAKQYEKARALFYEAIALEDQLNYDEPPDWFFSVRHELGALLIKTGKYEEAEKIYRQDLQIWRENAWALVGLYHALDKQGQKEEAGKVKIRFDKAWQYADIRIDSSGAL
ncbi:tetratricopeptide repeat protein [Flavobacterium sp.]|uniref:tetratricopeptide repeat protein n=1 Tax=Flavobacterium sp. TaxID=239 RepID=UPI0039E3784C